MQRFIYFLENVLLTEIEGKVVIFIDEIDNTLKLDFRDDFFAAIRAIYNDRQETPAFNRLTFVLLGVASPADLVADRQRTPFNIGKEIMLSPLEKNKAKPLEEGLENAYPGMGMELLGRVFHWTGGHPYLTRQAFYTMIEKGLTWEQLEQIASSESGPFRSHLHFYLSQLARQPKLVKGLQEIIKTNQLSDENVLYRLSAAGLIKENSLEGVEMRCDLYEQYFSKTLNA